MKPMFLNVCICTHVSTHTHTISHCKINYNKYGKRASSLALDQKIYMIAWSNVLHQKGTIPEKGKKTHKSRGVLGNTGSTETAFSDQR